jgi:hypothetical protein
MSTNGTNGMNGAAFDIDTLRSDDTGELTILHPVTGEPTTWVWTLAGPGHPRSIAEADKAAKQTLKEERERDQAMVNRRKYIAQERTPEQNRKMNAETFAARVISWTPARINGADYPYSHENVVKLLLNPAYGRVYVQLLEYFASEKSFTPPSATTSSDTPNEISN